MVFTSFVFFLFLPIVFGLYWFVFQRNLKAQNTFMMAASYVFYGWWDWRFLFLIAFSTVVDYVLSLGIADADKVAQAKWEKLGDAKGPPQNWEDDADRRRKYLLWAALAINLSLLGFFKYYNFFVTSFVAAFAGVGIHLPEMTLDIILPVGISFYTFQSLSYTLDVYKGKLQPTRDFLTYGAYVAFFPQLVAGPIERAYHFLPQLLKPRKFDYTQAVDGMRLMLWGMFKKVVIADNLAVMVKDIFDHNETYSSITLALGAIYFTIQVYCDFSGYSDIAIGVAKLFGYELLSNFRFPLFARTIPEFWSRWHISLTTWLNDYLFTPLSLALRDYRKGGIATAIVITFFVSGLWHGAKWTFVLWGLMNGLMFIPYVLRGKLLNRNEIVAKGKWLPRPMELLQIALIFGFWSFTLIFFGAEDMAMAKGYLHGLFTHFGGPILHKTGIYYVLGLLLLDWLNREDERRPKVLGIGPRSYRLSLEIVMVIVIFFNMLNGYKPFVYFDF
jgi:alginate O-acetyltransferase complex protein AlgI